MTISEFLSADTVEPSVLAYLIARENSWLRYEVERAGKIAAKAYSDKGREQLSMLASRLHDVLSNSDSQQLVGDAMSQLLNAYTKRAPDLLAKFEALVFATGVYSKTQMDFLEEFVPDALDYLNDKGDPLPVCENDFQKLIGMKRAINHLEAKSLLLRQRELVLQEADTPFAADEPVLPHKYSFWSNRTPPVKLVIVMHPDHGAQLPTDRNITPLHDSANNLPEFHLTWHLTPVILQTGTSEWLLLNEEFGFAWLTNGPSESEQIENIVVSLIGKHLPKQSPELNVSVNLDTDDIIWCSDNSMPIQMSEHFDNISNALSQQTDFLKALSAIAKINNTATQIHGEQISPTEAMNNFLHVLAAEYADYIENTNPITLLWHRIIGKPGWM